MVKKAGVRTKSESEKRPGENRIRHYFLRPPVFPVAFQFSSRVFSGVRQAPKDGRALSRVIIPLERDLIHPSFFEKNLPAPEKLIRRLQAERGRFGFPEREAACLLPEMSHKTFVFAFDSLPASRQERERLLRFRIKKQMPKLPDDTRLVWAVQNLSSPFKVVVSAARAAVVKEYEDILGHFGFRIRAVSGPTLSLSNWLDRPRHRDFLLVNIEFSSFSLSAFNHAAVTIYRQKPFMQDAVDEKGRRKIYQTILQEIEHTLTFIEDRARETVDSLWVRIGVEEWSDALPYLKTHSRLPVHEVREIIPWKMTVSEKNLLAPVLGELLK